MTTMTGFQARQRIERLESLLKRVLAAAAVASTSFAGPVVANEAAAAAFPLTDVPGGQAQVFVLSHRSIWTKKNGVVGAQGIPPLAPHEVIATTAGPAGVLCRTEYSDPALRIGINDIWIDPANPAANDENNGLTALTPLKTGYELFRRWGWNASQPLVGCNQVTSVDGFVNIHIVSDIVSPDSLPVKVTNQSGNFGIRFIGGTPTVIRSGTLTDAVIAMNPAVPLGGTRLTVRDNTLASWAAFQVANRRVKMINGPAAGGTFQPQTNSLATPGQVQCSACQTTNEPAFSQSPTTVTPAVGNTYHVEQLVACNFGQFEFAQELNPAFGGFEAFINVIDLNLPDTGPQLWAPVTTNGQLFSMPFFNFYQCTIDRGMDLSQAGGIQLIACYYTNAIFNTGMGEAAILGGGMQSIAGTLGQISWSNNSPFGAIDFNFVANDSAIFLLSNASGKLFASWNARAIAGLNTGGHGVLFGRIGGFGQRAAITCPGTIWGAGNAGCGLLIGAGCRGVGPAQNITGTAGDVKLAQSLSGWWFEAATATYQPAAGPITCTWAHIAAAKGAAGFGGSAHEPDQDAHWVLTETTA